MCDFNWDYVGFKEMSDFQCNGTPQETFIFLRDIDVSAPGGATRREITKSH